MEVKNDLKKKAHLVGFMITNDDVDAIFQEWPEEWRDPLAEPMVEGGNQEDPLANEGGNVGTGNDAQNAQGNGHGDDHEQQEGNGGGND